MTLLTLGHGMMCWPGKFGYGQRFGFIPIVPVIVIVLLIVVLYLVHKTTLIQQKLEQIEDRLSGKST